MLERSLNLQRSLQNKGELWRVRDKIYSSVRILLWPETVCGSPSSDCLWPTWCFSWIFTGGWLQLKSLGPYVTVYCKGVRSEATRCPRSVAVQDSPLSHGYFPRLTSSAFAGSAFLATAVPSDLPFGGIELAWLHWNWVHLAFLARVCKWPTGVLSHLFICIWPLTTTPDKRAPTCDVVEDAVT